MIDAALVGNNLAYSYSTYLGGTLSDFAEGIAVDANGSAYVVGSTTSLNTVKNFPQVNGIPQMPSGLVDAFITKVASNGGSLEYSTLLGGSSGDGGTSIAVDSTGSAYVTGGTSSDDFYQENPLPFIRNQADIFVSKIAPGGGDVLFSTLFGTSVNDQGFGIAVDNNGNAFITGTTESEDFPTTEGAYQRAADGLGDNAFVIRIASNLPSPAETPTPFVRTTTPIPSFTPALTTPTITGTPEPPCLWQRTPGTTKLLYYSWGSLTPASAWYPALQQGIANWHRVQTKFKFVNDPAVGVSVFFTEYTLDDGNLGQRTMVGCNGNLKLRLNNFSPMSFSTRQASYRTLNE
jgi:hypothetical protein